MSRPFKFVLLFLALLLPGVIYVFLKTFGRNEFEVPALFQEGLVPSISGCEGYVYTMPYAVPDSILADMAWKPGSVTLVLIDPLNSRDAVDRVNEEFAQGDFTWLEVGDSARTTAACALALPPNTNVALLDENRRIRGQYDATDREDTDRLILELKIVLKQY